MAWISPTSVENIKIAWQSLTSQKLRATLTISIIAVGILALVGMITAVTAIEAKIKSEFSRLGSNSFTIRAGSSMRHGGSQGKNNKAYESIQYAQAHRFKDQFALASAVSITANASFNTTVTYGSEATNPNVSILGCDEAYLKISSYQLKDGRIFSQEEINLGSNVIILGNDVVEKIFIHGENPIDQMVRIGSHAYRVIGLLASKGNTMGFAGDNQCLIPTLNVKKCFNADDTDYSIQVQAQDHEALAKMLNEAVNLMRVIRGDEPGEE